MHFASPEYLIVLAVLGAALAWYELRGRTQSRMILPGAMRAAGERPSLRARLAGLPRFLSYAALALALIALARPQAGQKNEEISNRGIDIMLVLDTSTSMRAIDFKPENRLEAAKKVAREFVKGREHDRIGVVVFAGFAFTQCPLTADREAVQNLLDQTEIGMTQVDGTAIGSAIATAAGRLKDGQGKSRVMILLTDGRSNAGEIDPLTAAQAAGTLGIKIYTIGAGKPGGALYPVDHPVLGRQYVKIPDQELDEDTLAKVAEATGGRYFRAADTESLTQIFRRIDGMEKTEISAVTYTNYTELYKWFLWPAIILLILDLPLAGFILARTP